MPLSDQLMAQTQNNSFVDLLCVLLLLQITVGSIGTFRLKFVFDTFLMLSYE